MPGVLTSDTSKALARQPPLGSVSPTRTTTRRPTDARPRSGTELPFHFIPIRHICSGTTGSVYFCLPRPASSTHSNTTALRAQLCAVKVLTNYPTSKLASEVEILKLLKEASPAGPSSKAHIVELLDYSITSKHAWLSMRPITGPSIQHLRDATDLVFPDFLLYHLFIQLVSALQYLHSIKPPLEGILHNDLYFGNILLDPSHQDFTGLPNVVLVDFGLSEVRRRFDESRCFKEEARDVSCLVNELVVETLEWQRKAGEVDEAEDLRQFSAFLSGVWDMSLNAMWEAWGKKATKLRGKPGTRHLPREMSEVIAGFQVTDEEIEKAARGDDTLGGKEKKHT